MPAPSPRRPSLRCEWLEPRDTPAGPLVADSFDQITTYWLPPANWQSATTNGQDYYGVGWAAALSGTQSMAVYGNLGVTSYGWNTTPVPADVVVAAAVRDGSPAPVSVFARGQNLSTPAAASAVSAVLTPSGAVELHQVTAGADQVLARVAPAAAGKGAWTRLTLTVRGMEADVQAQRTDTGAYLAADGTWQAAATTAIRVTGLTDPPVANSLAGIGRLPGPYGTAFVDDFSVDLAPPLGIADIPRHYPNIRLAQLAYSGTPVGPTETGLLQSSIDLVVSNPAFLQTFNQASPNTPQLIYSNVSNLYQGLLTDWLSYAARTGADPEAALYHVAQATPFQGDSPSSQPVTWFWDVRGGPAAGGTSTDLTSAAHGGGTTGVPLGGAGQATAVGYPEPFREVNVTLSRAAAAGWSGVWEYAVADAHGNVTWKPLTLLTDTTGGLKANGQVTFNPPAGWKAVTLPGSSAALYYVRFRATAGTTAQAPVARTVLGRDYVGANGMTSGVIPAFDYAADKNHDGYLDDAEYANRKPGFDARFAYESRLFYPYYGQMRFATNPSAPAFRAWAADYHTRVLAQNPLADGIFMDNSNGKPTTGGAAVLESTATFGADYAAMIRAVNQAIAPRWVMVNTAGAAAPADPVAAAAGAALEEFLLRPMSATWSQVGDVTNLVAGRLASANPSPYLVIDTLPTGGSPTDPRMQLATLAYYYLVADPDKTFLMVDGGNDPSAPWSQKWIPAAAVDVGRPTGSLTTFASGADPQNPALTYKVFARAYGNGLVLYKPLSYTQGVGTGTTADATATTHALGGRYRVVNADGTLGPVVTSVTLRNGEGVVLVKA